MSILFGESKTKNSLRKKETFNVPVDVVIYGSTFVAGAAVLLSILGGLFV